MNCKRARAIDRIAQIETSTDANHIMKERDVVRQIRDYLIARHICHVRISTGKFFSDDGRAFISHSLGRGTADILALSSRKFVLPVPLWIECKRPKAKQTEEQKLFQRWAENEMGHDYIVAHSIDDLKAIGL